MVKNRFEKFNFLRDLSEPILVLAFDAEKCIKEPHFNKKYKFEPIIHQCAGVGCHHRYLYIHKLEFKSKKLAFLAKKLHKFYFGTSLGCFGPQLDNLVKYDKNLKELFGMGCNYTWSELQEAIYPIDIDWLHKVTKTVLPHNLDDLLVFDNKCESLCGSYNRWKLLILAENSD